MAAHTVTTVRHLPVGEAELRRAVVLDLPDFDVPVLTPGAAL